MRFSNLVVRVLCRVHPGSFGGACAGRGDHTAGRRENGAPGRDRQAPRRALYSPARRARRSRPTTCGTPRSPACRSIPTRARGSGTWLPDRPICIRTTGRAVDEHPTAFRGRSAGRTPGQVRFEYASRERPGPVSVLGKHADRGRPARTGDRHALMVDPKTCVCTSSTTPTTTPNKGRQPARARSGTSLQRLRPPAGPRPTPPGCRSSPAWSTTTR